MARRLVLLAGAAAAFSPSAPAARAPRWLGTATDVETSTEDSCVSFTVEVPAALTKAAYKAAAGEMAQTREIPGWLAKDWKKVPVFVVANAVGTENLKGLAIEKLTETEVPSAIGGLDVEVVGQAQLVGETDDIVEAFKPGEPWAMRCKIDIWPEAIWSQPWDDGSLAVEVERETKDQSTRDKALEALRERYCDIEDAPADHVAREGDVAVVDIDGYLRDEEGKRAGDLPIQGAVGGDDLELVLEPGKFLPGVVEAIVGKKAGTMVTVPVDFPESRQYREEQPLAGVKAGFDVTIREIRLRSLPALDDAFAGKIRPGLTLAELQQEVENTVGGQEEDKTTDTVHTELEKALAGRLTSSLPEALVVESAKQRFAVMLADMRNSGTDDAALKQMISPEGFQKYLKVVRPRVVTELRGRLAVESIGKELKMSADETQVEEQMELVKRQYEQQEADSGAAFNEDKAREKVSSELLRVAVLDKVRDSATVNYIEARSPEEAARAMGIDVDNLPPEVTLG